MDGVLRARFGGPLEPYGAGFASVLEERGYSEFSARLNLQLAANLSRWLDGEACAADDLTPDLLERFAAARRAAGYRHQRSTHRSRR